MFCGYKDSYLGGALHYLSGGETEFGDVGGAKQDYMKIPHASSVPRATQRDPGQGQAGCHLRGTQWWEDAAISRAQRFVSEQQTQVTEPRTTAAVLTTSPWRC